MGDETDLDGNGGQRGQELHNGNVAQLHNNINERCERMRVG